MAGPLWFSRHSATGQILIGSSRTLENRECKLPAMDDGLSSFSCWLPCPFAGCGNMSAENTGLASSPLKASDARLKIYRTGNLVASVGAASVKVDGREVANMGIGGSTMLDVPAGVRKIVVGHWGHPNDYTITVDAKPGMLYTLEISPRMEAAVAGVAFGMIGWAVEAAANENGGTYQIRVVDSTPIKR